MPPGCLVFVLNYQPDVTNKAPVLLAAQLAALEHRMHIALEQLARLLYMLAHSVPNKPLRAAQQPDMLRVGAKAVSLACVELKEMSSVMSMIVGKGPIELRP